MNKLGIEQFKKEICVGDQLSVSTREHKYNGAVTAIFDNYLEVDEDGLTFQIKFAHIWAYTRG
ncbi:hypothetical protein [Cytobacillus firmus]|uniref:hypothetical protein n=1 Tax=Cytobacillus firmus TaxID=1399 RepID=UPI0030024E32